ncbi:MAG TPA: type IV pilus secretin PilQ [Vicinamibacterales bacterium]|nr:type IV pilus secretin PilQ [Vicinamibacterales bacterium]
MTTQVKGVRAGSREPRAVRWTCPALALTAAIAVLSGSPGASPLPAAATTIESIQAKHAASRTTVTLRGNGQLTPANVEETPDPPRRLVLDFAGVAAKAAAQTRVDSPLVKEVRLGVHSREPLVTRVVMELAAGSTYHIERGADSAHDLAIVFERGQTPSTVLIAATEPTVVEPEPAITLDQAVANAARLVPQNPPAAAVQPPAAQPSNVEPAAPPPAAKPSAAPQPVPERLAAQQPPPPQPPQPPAQQPPLTQPGERRYIGSPVSLDLEGADLRATLRTLVEHGGLNVVFDPSVQGTVDMIVRDIPWDQALETILRTNKLGYVAEGTIIRIAPLNVLAEEEAERRKLSEARALAGDLGVRTFSLSYAKAQDLQALLTRSALSARGQIQVDPRTNTLIITDLPDRLQTAANLITSLDRAEPQVEVEARIVQTTRDFAKAIGIQWGLNGRMTPEIGNTTNLAFPNRGSLGGRLGVQGPAPTDPRATGSEQTGTVIGLPAQNLGSAAVNTAIGLALGSVNGAFNLDVALSALERTGKGRVLSTPRLTTQNNIQAKVQQGIQIPIQTVANNTVTVTFKEAVLMLQVTPQITAAGTVIMQVTVTNMAADFSRQVNGIPPIDTQEAHTQVQVEDGATTVIGGIFVSREQASTDKTPLLHRIPLLGWLFRRDSVQDESRELLIFITPRILKG